MMLQKSLGSGAAAIFCYLMLMMGATTTTMLVHAFSPGAADRPQHQQKSTSTKYVEVTLLQHQSTINRPSKTLRESATLVDWEMRTELDRRVEDGFHYEHYFIANSWQQFQQEASSNDATPTVRGIFCGYRFTDEEHDRLRSAHAAADDEGRHGERAP